MATKWRAGSVRARAFAALPRGAHGYGAPEDRERALAAGFDAHVVKPVDPDRLAAVLAESESSLQP
jgi:hypothetical protein